MLIVNKKFHDYYDTALGVTGVDKTVVYDRSSKILSPTTHKTRLKYDSYNPYKYKNCEINYKKFCIGFCGEIIPGVMIKEDVIGSLGKTPIISAEYYFYNLDDLLDYLNGKGILKEKGWFNPYGYKSKFPWDAKLSSEKELEVFFDSSNWNTGLNGLSEIFINYKVPVFYVDQYEGVVSNPKLSKYQFAKVKDPYTAFQDIYMYISGVIGVKTPEMVKISDKDMAHKKGHGGKYSFKKPPGTKKRGK